jgi:hypothetical protein
VGEEQFVKQTIDWQAVRGEVNKRLDADYSVNYIQNVWHGNLKSSRILEALKAILPADMQPGAADE